MCELPSTDADVANASLENFYTRMTPYLTLERSYLADVILGHSFLESSDQFLPTHSISRVHKEQKLELTARSRQPGYLHPHTTGSYSRPAL